MNRILLSITLFLFSVNTFATPATGGEITYKYIGNNQFDVTFIYYRDCRDDSLIEPFFSMRCMATGKTLNITAYRVSIRDLSTACDTMAKCSPSNFKISTTNPIFEAHIYTARLDFNSVYSDLKNCCTIKLGMGYCCRLGTTTGSSGGAFWVTSTLDLCKAPTNSSPVFSSVPMFVVAANQALYLNFAAQDTMDGDSLSYSFTNPMQNWVGKTTWSGGYSSTYPMKAYFIGTTKPPYSNPNLDPPVGIYIDTSTGTIILTPTEVDQVSILAVSVKEWRKDNAGKYIQIGEIIRDVKIFVIASPANNPPKITNKIFQYSVCAGTKLCFDITTEDKVYVPPPPAKTPPPDSITLTWNAGIKGATFTINNNKAREKRATFCWTPQEKDVSDIPYSFIVKAQDNHCPINAVANRIFTIVVQPDVKVNHNIEKLNDHTYIGKGGVDSGINAKYTQFWQVLDSTGKSLNILNHNYRNGLFFIMKPNNINHSTDTIIFRRNGKYIINHVVSIIGYCTKSFMDTVIVKNISMEVSLSLYGDTIVCKQTTIRINAKVTNGVRPFKYKWKKDGKITADTTEFIDFTALNTFLLEVEVKDSGDKLNSTSLYVNAGYSKPKFKTNNDTLVCEETELKLKAIPLTKVENIKKWEWRSSAILIGITDSLKTKTAGIFSIRAENGNGCYGYDTVIITNFRKTKLVLKDGEYCQDKNELNQNEIILSPGNLGIYSKMEWTLLKSLKNKSGRINLLTDLLSDEDLSSNYLYKIKFDKSLIDLSSSKKDSLRFSLLATDSFSCLSADTMTIQLIKNPSLSFNKNPFMICRNNSVDLNSNLITDGVAKWIATNAALYNIWPDSGEISNGKIKGKYFKPDGGTFLSIVISDFEGCKSAGSIDLAVFSSPIPLVNYMLYSDSIKFTDNSLYATNRKWYLDNVYVDNTRAIVFTQKAVNNKPLRLDLNNSQCVNDTTLIIQTLEITKPKSSLITIYPNPVNQTLTIETSQTKPYKIRVLNTLGQIVLLKDLDYVTEILEVSNLSNGIYFLEIEFEKSISRLRFVKE